MWLLHGRQLLARTMLATLYTVGAIQNGTKITEEALRNGILVFSYYVGAGDSFLSVLSQSARPSGSDVSSSRLPVPSTNSSYVDFSGNGRGPSSSIMSSLCKTSFSRRRSATCVCVCVCVSNYIIICNRQ